MSTRNDEGGGRNSPRDLRDTTAGQTYQRLQRWRIVIFLVILAAVVLYAAAKLLF